MSAYLAITSIWLRSITSVISFRFSARAASRSRRSPSSPRPWKLYGELRGLNAPPRKIFAPARRTAAAVARTCFSFSAEHGPAITMTSSPPMRTSPTDTTVPSGLKVRLASLYGEEILTTSWTPSSISIRPGSGCPCPTAPSTVRSTPVDRCTSMPISTRRATTCAIWSSVARSCMTTTMVCFASNLPRISRLPILRDRGDLAVDHAPFEPSGLIDDALEQPCDGVRPQRPFHCDVPHVLEHLLLALGLIQLDALFFFHPSDFARHARALVQEPDEHLVHPIDVVAKIVKRAHARLSATVRIL